MVNRFLYIYITRLFVLFSCHISVGQEVVAISSLGDYRYIRELPGVSWQNTFAPTIETLNEKDWKSLDTLPIALQAGYAWLQLKVENDLPKPMDVDFLIPHADSIVLFSSSGKPEVAVVTGPYVSVGKWQHPENPGLASLLLKAGEEKEVYLRLWSAEGRPFSLQSCRIQTRAETLTQAVEGFRESGNRTEFNGFFLGAIAFALLFALVVYIRIREKVFLFYALYLAGIAIYAVIVKTLPYSAIAKAAYLDYPLTYKLGEPIQYLSFASYIVFGRYLLETDKYPRLGRMIRVLMHVLLWSGLGLLIYNLVDFQYRLQERAFLVSRIIILPASLILIFWVSLSVRSPVKWFFVVGSSLFLLGGLLAVAVDPKTRHLFLGITPFSPVYLFKTGILAETFCFALALGYKLRANQREKEAITQSYISQLELNRQFIATENLRLEEMVRERTEEMAGKSAELEIQYQKRIKSEFEKQLVELEMKALRSQINPHFIFNSLNSIRYQILKKDYEKASDYLVRFAKLLRKLLQSSREQVTTLQEELEIVSLYLDMERLRFNDNFSYDIVASPALELDEILIPPMLLQPYVENAVKHGLIHSRNPVKNIRIEIAPEPGGSRIEIRDNGVGRANALPGRTDGYSGLGLKITLERIALFNQRYKQQISIEITDLYQDNLPSGTLVTLFYRW